MEHTLMAPVRAASRGNYSFVWPASALL